MNLIAVSHRVRVLEASGAREDTIDQRWWPLLSAAGLLPVAVPNDVRTTMALLRELPVSGVILTGGNDLVSCGGDAPERDETERALIDAAVRTGTPLLGVCRGMQVIQEYFGATLGRVRDHAVGSQRLSIGGVDRWVNSYHHWAARSAPPCLQVWVRAPDGTIKAVRHETLPIQGIMWHPERLDPLAAEDVALLRAMFGTRR